MDTYPTRDRMTGFLYEVLRDGCPVGVLEQIVRNEEQISESPDPPFEIVLSNGHLGKYAEELAKRLEKAWAVPLPTEAEE